MDLEFLDRDLELAPLWSMFFATFSLAAVLTTLALWALVTQSIVSSLFPAADTIEIGKLTASLLAVIVNLGFSAGLIYIYVRQTGVLREQKNISNEQTTIQDRQRKIMEADYIPEVSIEVDEIEEDTVKIQCTNNGTGLAKHFEVEVEFFVSRDSMDDPAEYDQGVELERLSETSFSHTSHVPNYGDREQIAYYNGAGSKPRRPSENGNAIQVRTEEILREKDSDILEFSVYFERFVDPGGNPENPSRLSFSDGIEALQDEGIETIGFGLNISYQDVFDQEVADEPLISSWVDIRDGATLEELFEKSSNRGVFSTPKPFRDRDKVYRTGVYPYI
jgi:hypothetical protein